MEPSSRSQRSPRRAWRAALPLAGLLSAALLLAPSCTRPRKTEASTGSTAEAPVVAVARASRQDLARNLVLTAEFKPYQEVDVMAKVAGYVKKINVDIGDRVREGQLLATLEVPEMADDLTRSAANVEHAQSELARAQDELRRARDAHDIADLTAKRLIAVMKSRPGLVAQQEVDDAHSRDLVAEAQVAVAQSGLASAQNQLKVAQAEQARTKTLYEYTRVTAPFTGVITKRFADTGSMIQAGTASQTQAMPLVRLSQNNLLRLILPVPEAQVSLVRVGQGVEVKVPSLNRSFPGKLVRFADQLQVSTRTMDTEVDVPNPELVLIPGMYATVDLTLAQRNDVLAIPVTAVNAGAEKPTVLRVGRDNTIEELPVEIGMQTPNRVEVRAGLSDGDLVVIGNRNQLRPGERVTPKIVEMAALKDGQ
jgi:RND family efflux transporter MFP subunit